MKTFKTIIVLMSLVSILNCSNDGENESSREYITTCYKFVEEGSNLPISGQSVLIHYGYSNIMDLPQFYINLGWKTAILIFLKPFL